MAEYIYIRHLIKFEITLSCGYGINSNLDREAIVHSQVLVLIPREAPDEKIKQRSKETTLLEQSASPWRGATNQGPLLPRPLFV